MATGYENYLKAHGLNLTFNKLEMKQIVIGDKPLMQISEEDILQVAVIQGCCAHPDYWNYPTLTEYDNTMFRDSVWCSYKSTRKEDNWDSSEITFFFNPKDLSYHTIIESGQQKNGMENVLG